VSGFTFILPDDFDDCEWEATAKGWCPGARLIVLGKSYCLTFYDAVRLGQTIQSELEGGRSFFEPNLVVVRAVTRAEMERAAEWLVQSGQVAFLVEQSLSTGS